MLLLIPWVCNVKAFVKLCRGVLVTITQLRPVKWITRVIGQGATLHEEH